MIGEERGSASKFAVGVGIRPAIEDISAGVIRIGEGLVLHHTVFPHQLIQLIVVILHLLNRLAVAFLSGNGFDIAPAVIGVHPGHIAVGHFADQSGGGAKGIPIQIFVGSGKVGAKV